MEVSKVLGPLLGGVAIAAIVIAWTGYVAGNSSAFPDPSAELSSDAPVIEASDRITHPPVRQSTEAAPYELVVAASDEWRSPLANLQLYKSGTLRWQKTLPHQYGPRFSLVTPTGQVLLFDEYINVASPHAITLIDETGTEVAHYSFDDIKQVLAISLAEITQQASSGLWISEIPVLSATGDLASVKTGGTMLEINLTTGELGRRDDLL